LARRNGGILKKLQFGCKRKGLKGGFYFAQRIALVEFFC